MSTLHATRLTNDPGHINSEQTDDSTVIVWGEDAQRVEAETRSYLGKGYRVLETWEMPDSEESRATLKGQSTVHAG